MKKEPDKTLKVGDDMKRVLALVATLILLLGSVGCLFSLSPRATVEKFVGAWESFDQGKLGDVFANSCTEWYETEGEGFVQDPESPYSRQEQVDYYGGSEVWPGLEGVSFQFIDQDIVGDVARVEGILTLSYVGSPEVKELKADLEKSPQGKWQICGLWFGLPQGRASGRAFGR